jgi:hypothetical protein
VNRRQESLYLLVIKYGTKEQITSGNVESLKGNAEGTRNSFFFFLVLSTRRPPRRKTETLLVVKPLVDFPNENARTCGGFVSVCPSTYCRSGADLRVCRKTRGSSGIQTSAEDANTERSDFMRGCCCSFWRSTQSKDQEPDQE